MIYTNTLYLVKANAKVYPFIIDNNGVFEPQPNAPTAHELININIDDYHIDPLIIEPEKFITYCADDDTTEIVTGNTNYIQYRAIWSDTQGNEYSVKVDDLTRIGIN